MADGKPRLASPTHAYRRPSGPVSSPLSRLLEETGIASRQRSSDASAASVASAVGWPSPALARLRSLHPAEYIVLFSPVVPHPRDTTQSRDTDPFEPLGRALSKRHKRIRHVPYFPTVGITSTHAEFLRAAGAVAIVVCCPGDSSAPADDKSNISSASDGVDGLSGQMEFADDVVQMTAKDASLSSVPVIVLLIAGGSGGTYESSINSTNQQIALVRCAEYTPSALWNAAEVMLGN